MPVAVLTNPAFHKRTLVDLQRKLASSAIGSLKHGAAKVSVDTSFSMRAAARGFGEGLTLARVDKPLKEEAVGC